MIQNGSTVILRTKDAIYSTCKIVEMSTTHVTIKYHAGQKRDRNTNEFVEDRRTASIPRQKIEQMSERI